MPRAVPPTGDRKLQSARAIAEGSDSPNGAYLPEGGELRIVLPPGSLAFIGAFVSLATCYGTIFATAVFGLQSATLEKFVNPHVQAIIMWGFAILTVFALWRDSARHQSNVPLALGAVATAILVATLYVRYDVKIEAFAYVLLLVSALLNQNAFLTALNRTAANQAREIETLNNSLAQRVELQGVEIDRLGRLKRLLAPQVADLVVKDGNEQLLESHRRYIACLFCDLRGFTALSETIEPEEVMSILQAYHDEIGSLVSKHNGTIGCRAGDGAMAFFNDPVPCDQPVLAAVRAAFEVRTAFERIRAPWTKLGHSVGLGIGISSGYATIGLVGFEGRADYTAIGGVVNVAARICDRAVDGQILIGQRAFVDVESDVHASSLGAWDLKGVTNPVPVYDVAEIRKTT